MRHAALPASLAALLAGLAHAETPAASSATVTSGTAFNPQISLILTGQYAHDNVGGHGAELIDEAAGILHGAHFHGHEHGAGNGFALGESELVIAATIDPYLDGRFTATFSGHGDVAIEEAWLQTRMLPAGLKVKAGKFLSEIGYQNSQHPHAWDFSDQNLAYSALLGAHGLIDTGLQLTWLAPAPFYLLLGAEALQGNDQERFGTLIGEDDAATVLDPAAGTLPEAKDGPRLGTVFAKFGPDLGDRHALQLGLSYARASQYQQVIDEDDSLVGDEFALDGRQTLYGADFVYKFDSNGDKGQGDFKLAAEYLRMKKEMRVSGADAFAPVAAGEAISGRQDGYYVQATYGIAPRWTAGLRYDASGDTNELVEAGTPVGFGRSSRTTLAVSFYPSEFSRLRLQAAKGYICDEACETTGARSELDQIMLTYTLSLGPHGAHRF